MTWTVAQEVQYQELSAEECFNPDNHLGHGLIAVTSRSWRDWFRKRRYWRCWYCDFREEMVK